MRKFAVLGASALVLALGVAQASAMPSYRAVAGARGGQNAAVAPSANSDLSGFRAQVADQGAVQVQRPVPASVSPRPLIVGRPPRAGRSRPARGTQVRDRVPESEV